jgi:FKBP-type peptidyl-prolyl cis-trans isomerase (trigger factor)
MEEQKQTVETEVEQTPQVKLVDKEPVVAAFEQTTPAPKKKNIWLIAGAVVLVVIALGAVWMRLEREGRVGTTFFAGMFAAQEASAPVATVNGQTLRNADLMLSVEQLEQAAIAQGQNLEDPAVQTQIQELAVEMLVNTTLLKQQAQSEGIVITEAQVTERMEQLEIEAGGAEVLAARMEEFGIDRDTFAADVRTELTIVALLESVFSDSDLQPTDEEVTALYEEVAQTQTDVPPLDEVRPQVEAQLQQNKEQQAVEMYLEELRAVADIEIVS